jgi:polyhydroxyalkanoate synthesis repressor PhaR
MPMIKRYPNRKLYNTESKHYVTLENIALMIQDGSDVQIIDHETGEDLTNLTLSQIIFEQEKKGSGLLPRALLTNLVRASNDTFEHVRRTLLGAGEPEDAPPADASPLQRLDDVLQEVLHSLNVPTQRDLKQLQAQLDELNLRISTLLAEEEARAASNGAQGKRADAAEAGKDAA